MKLRYAMALLVAFHVTAAGAQPHALGAEQQLPFIQAQSVGGYLEPPVPQYPKDAKAAGRQGRVQVRVVVDGDGYPTKATVQSSSGSPDLDSSAVAAILKARLKPQTVDGKPTGFITIIPVTFQLKVQQPSGPAAPSRAP
jgi:protein TonB